ncbi:YdcF family protein [Paenibacillus chitinolyticus]|uniref:YdcF family protein n=1 Tax=Paenibacillus chitinolyticus TaxID=79263 RepID=UPI0035D65211
MKRWSGIRKAKVADVLLVLTFLSSPFLFRGRFGMMLFGIAVVLLLIIRRIDFSKRVRLRKTLWAGSLLIALSFAVVESFVVSQMGADEAETSGAATVVILGSGLKGYEVSLTLQERLDAGFAYVSGKKDITVVVSGGQGPGENVPEAVAMRDYLVKKGIVENRILLESRSTSTLENLRFTKAVLKEKGINDPKILIVTSDYHMYRAKLLAKREGYEAYGLSSPSPAHLKPINMIREYFAMIKTWVS